MVEAQVIPDLSTPMAAALEQTPGVLSTIYMYIPWGLVFVTYIFVFVDLFYGVTVSYLKREVVSRRMLKGLRNKIFVLFVPIIGICFKAFFVICSLPAEWSGSDALTSVFGVSQLSQFPICFLLCLFVLLMEFLSFLETSAKIDKRAAKLLNLIHKEADKKAAKTEEIKDAIEALRS